MNLTITRQRATVTAPPADAQEERQLAARLARGDSAAFDELVERFAPRVAALAARLLGAGRGAEDVAQDVFVAVLEKRGAFRGQSSLWTYLAAITVNRCRSLARRRWLHERLLRMPGTWVERQTGPEQQTAVDETLRTVREAVDALPVRYREAIVLRYFEQMAIDAMARVLGLRRNAVEARLSRARKMLKEQLADLADEM
jgi:RNA polymerase sigma factor (sigma-70 family)